MIDPSDVDQEPFTPGWVPDGWEKGNEFVMTRTANAFILYDHSLITSSYEFPNWRLPAFYEWLEWWNDE